MIVCLPGLFCDCVYLACFVTVCLPGLFVIVCVYLACFVTVCLPGLFCDCMFTWLVM